MYLGEEVSNRNVVDIGRLQKLIVTVLLVVVYVSLLCDQPGTVLSVVVAQGQTAAGARMPAVDSGFVWLLGISHAADLANKAAPKSSPS